MQTFHLKYDKSAIAATIFVVALISFFFVVFNFYLSKEIDFWIIFADLILITPFFIAFLYAPKCYIVDNEKVIVKKYHGEVIISRNDIKNIFQINSGELSGMIRKFASGGFLGYYGKFYSDKFHDIYVYSRSLSSNLLLIEKNDGTKYLIAPKNINLFLETINQE